MKIFLALFLCFGIVGGVFGQDCRVKAADLPAFESLQLGMAKKLLDKIYPGLTYTPDNNRQTAVIPSSKLHSAESSKDISVIEIATRRNRLDRLTITFENYGTWKTNKDLAILLFAAFKIPTANLTQSPDSEAYTTSCADFSATAELDEQKHPRLTLKLAK